MGHRDVRQSPASKAMRPKACVPYIDLPGRQTQVLSNAILGIAVWFRATLEEILEERSLFRRCPFSFPLFIARLMLWRHLVVLLPMGIITTLAELALAFLGLLGRLLVLAWLRRTGLLA